MSTARVRALADFRAPYDRLRNGTVRLFTRGDVHALPDEVAVYLVAAGLAERVGEEGAALAAPAPTGEPEVPAAAEAERVRVTVDELERSGSWYTLPNGDRVQGRAAAELALEALS